MFVKDKKVFADGCPIMKYGGMRYSDCCMFVVRIPTEAVGTGWLGNSLLRLAEMMMMTARCSFCRKAALTPMFGVTSLEV